MGIRDIILSPITAIYAYMIKAQKGLKIEDEIKTVLSLILIYTIIGGFTDFRITLALTFGSAIYLVCIAIYLGIDIQNHAKEVVNSGKNEVVKKLNKAKRYTDSGDEILGEEEIYDDDETKELWEEEEVIEVKGRLKKEEGEESSPPIRKAPKFDEREANPFKRKSDDNIFIKTEINRDIPAEIDNLDEIINNSSDEVEDFTKTLNPKPLKPPTIESNPPNFNLGDGLLEGLKKPEE